MSARPERASWSPLDCRGTALPPPVLAAAKLLLLYPWIAGNVRWKPEVHLPFLPILDRLPVEALAPLFGVAFGLSSLALLFNRAVRSSSFVGGALIALSLLSARPVYSNSKTCFAILLLLIALQGRGGSRWMFRAQLFLVYFGAGLNKLFEADWRSGRFFEHWTREILHLDLYGRLATLLPDVLLSQLMSWLTIAAELTLAFAFLVPRLTRPAVIAGVAFHVGMLVFTAGDISWVFLYLMCVAYLCLARWPDRGDGADAPRHARLLERWATTPAACFALAALFFALRAQFIPLAGPLVRGF